MRAILSSDRDLTLILECSRILCSKFGYTVTNLLDKLKSYGFSCHALDEEGTITPLNLEGQPSFEGMVVARRIQGI